MAKPRPKYQCLWGKCKDLNSARGVQAALSLLPDSREDRVGPRETRLIAHLCDSPFVDDPERYSIPNRSTDVISFFTERFSTYYYKEIARMLTMLTAAEPEMLPGWLRSLYSTHDESVKPENAPGYSIGLAAGYFFSMKWLFDHFKFPPSDDSISMSSYDLLPNLLYFAGEALVSNKPNGQVAVEYGTYIAPAVKAFIKGPERETGDWPRHMFELWKALAKVGDWVASDGANIPKPNKEHILLGKIIVEQLTCKAIPELGWTGQAEALSAIGHHLTDPRT